MTSEYFETGYREDPQLYDDFCMCEEDKRCSNCDAALNRYRALGRAIGAIAPPPPQTLTPAQWAEFRMFLQVLTPDDQRQVADMARAYSLTRRAA